MDMVIPCEAFIVLVQVFLFLFIGDNVDKERKFYIYEWYIVDTGEVFYVGKGTGGRYKEHRRRNKMFLDFYRTHTCDVRLIYIDLYEDEAFYLEHLTIMYYIQNTNFRLTNQNTGGSGGQRQLYRTQAQIDASERRRGISVNAGCNNGMYGRNWTGFKTDEEIKEIGNKISSSLKGHVVSDSTRKKQSMVAKKRYSEGRTNFPDHSRAVMIVDKQTLKIVAEYSSIAEAKGNKYVKGHLCYKCLGKINNEKDKYMIMYKSYKITERELFVD